jgi:murein L,D-transpeptidase YcbB/YkuD
MHIRTVRTLAAAGFAFLLALPASAQSPAEPSAPGAPAAAQPAQAAEAAQPARAPEAPQPAPAPAAAQAASAPGAAQPAPAPEAAQPAPEVAQPAPPVDPVLAEVRQQLTRPPRGSDRGDVAALVAFYGEPDRSLIWVSKDGFAPRAKHAMSEIAKAEDWGLSAAAFPLPELPSELTPATIAETEIKVGLTVLKYARHARGGRLEPGQVSRYFDQKPPLRDPKAVLDAVAATDAAGDYLRSLHPKHPQFEKLRQALLKARGASKPDPEPERTVRLPDGPALKAGMDHPQVALLRRRLKVPVPAEGETFYDAALLDAVTDFQRENKMMPDGIVGARTRAVLNGEPKPALAGSEVQRLLVNMERWRWMPEDLGQFHVWDNIPEFTSRVLRNNQVIHSAKIIVGKVETQTVIFSANMKYVIFHPEWGVPDSIKVKEILPYLRPTGGGFFGFGGTDTRVLERHNLRVSYNGRPVDASSVNWDTVDIRRFTFIQPAGPSNVLGVVKFRFPNKHDIYMHDTPQRELFTRDVRTFSHGCIRVQNPGRLAELLLAEDKGWSASHVQNLLSQGYNNEVTLTRQIPVHVTYFTAVAGEDGQIRHFGDIYGHDNRTWMALSGRPLPLELLPSDSAAREVRRPKPYKQTNNDFFQGLFGN